MGYLIDVDYMPFRASQATTVFTPWMLRAADNLRVAVEVVAMGADNCELLVQAMHRNIDEVGDGVAIGSPIKIGSVGRSAVTECTGLKELVRFRITADEAGTGLDGWFLFRVLDPVWFDSERP